VAMGVATINQLAVAKATTATAGGKNWQQMTGSNQKDRNQLAVTQTAKVFGLATDAAIIIIQQ